MQRLELVRDSFRIVLHSRRIGSIQLLTNPLLFAAFAMWLLIPEARAIYLVLSLLVIMTIVATAIVLHAGTLNYFQQAHAGTDRSVAAAFRMAWKHILAIAFWAVICYFVCSQVDRLGDYQYSFPSYIRSMLPMGLRRMISEAGLDRLFDFFRFVLRWVVVPALLLPFALQAAEHGFRGYGRASLSVWARIVTNAQYWLVCALASVLGIYMVGLILSKAPTVAPAQPRLIAEITSLILRLIVSYLLVTFSWLMVGSALGRAERRPNEVAG